MRVAPVMNVVGRRMRRTFVLALAAAAGVTGVLAHDARAFTVCDPGCPDLSISNVTRVYNNGYPYYGSVTVRNSGLRSAGSSWLGAWGACGSTRYPVPPLAPGQAYRVNTADLIRCSWTVGADAYNYVAESNEGNNRRSLPQLWG